MELYELLSVATIVIVAGRVLQNELRFEANIAAIYAETRRGVSCAVRCGDERALKSRVEELKEFEVRECNRQTSWKYQRSLVDFFAAPPAVVWPPEY
jgi:hypothetical protein